MKRYTKREMDVAHPLILGEREFSIDAIAQVARNGASVAISANPAVQDRVNRAQALLKEWVDKGDLIYGVTTRFGALADAQLTRAAAADLQNSSVWAHKTGAGRWLPAECVRAGMLLRLNSHLWGHSGVRMELIRRLQIFLNEGITPRIREFGSIGASGDLVPLNYICGCLIGSPAGFEVSHQGELLDARRALAKVGLEPMRLEPKEGLAMMNGTSMSSGMAALLFYDARRLLAGTLAFHSLAFQALATSSEYFDPFVHQVKPHPGQQWTARRIRCLLEGSDFVASIDQRKSILTRGTPIQDRYSVRCAPQFLGPIVEEMAAGERQIEIDANGCSDNPLIDFEHATIRYGGNFLGQYISLAVDHLRHNLAMMAKHIDVQIALIMSPEFSNGLPASLVGNGDNPANIGLKGLQLTGNSIVPLLLHNGASLADRFPTYAEQFNQNLNSQSLGSCLLCAESVRQFRIYLALALLISVQAVDLRSKLVFGTYDPRSHLSLPTRNLYESVRADIDCPVRKDRPYVWNDDERQLDLQLERLSQCLLDEGEVVSALESILDASLARSLAGC